MKKILTTLVLIAGLLFGSVVAIQGPASAADCQIGVTCDPSTPPTCDVIGGCEPAPCPVVGGCDAIGYVSLLSDLGAAERTANDYRAQVLTLQAEVESTRASLSKVQARAARQAATIQRLRAVIRSLR